MEVRWKSPRHGKTVNCSEWSEPQAPLSPSNWSVLYRRSRLASHELNTPRQGWAIKDFSILSEMCSICEQPLYGIMLMILHTDKWCVLISDKNFQIFFKSIRIIPSASGHSHSPFTSCRTRRSWHNGSSLGPHVLNGYGSMTLTTTNTIYGKRDPALVDLRTTQVYCDWPAHRAGLLCCNFFDMLTPVPYHHFFSSLILLFIYV